MKLWIKKINADNYLNIYDEGYFYYNARICSDHFEDRFFTSTEKTKLHRYEAEPIDLRPLIMSCTNNDNSNSFIGDHDYCQNFSLITSSINNDNSNNFISYHDCSHNFYVNSNISQPQDSPSTSNITETPEAIIKDSLIPRKIETMPKTREIRRLKSQLVKAKRKILHNIYNKYTHKRKNYNNLITLEKLKDMLTERQFSLVKAQIECLNKKTKGQALGI